MAKGAFQRKQTAAAEEEKKEPARGRDKAQPLNARQARIQEWLKQVRFKKTLIGGVDEADVWKKIAELDDLYAQALEAERARCDALIQERVTAALRKMARQMQESQSAQRKKAGDGS